MGMVLLLSYAMSGTDLAYAATSLDHEEQEAVRCMVVAFRYPPTRALRDARIRTFSAVSGTDLAYGAIRARTVGLHDPREIEAGGAIRLRACYAKRGTDLAKGVRCDVSRPICPRICYAVSGTDLARGGTSPLTMKESEVVLTRLFDRVGAKKKPGPIPDPDLEKVAQVTQTIEELAGYGATSVRVRHHHPPRSLLPGQLRYLPTHLLRCPVLTVRVVLYLPTLSGTDSTCGTASCTSSYSPAMSRVAFSWARNPLPFAPFAVIPSIFSPTTCYRSPVNATTILCAPYAMPGTDVARITMCLCALYANVWLMLHVALPEKVFGVELVELFLEIVCQVRYRATRALCDAQDCPLRARYAMPGTDKAYGDSCQETG
eukprot:980209-Rhodomonas_salina.4